MISMLSMMNTKLAKGEKNDEDPKKKGRILRNKATRKNDEGLREKRCKTNDDDKFEPKEVSRERERDPERTSASFSYRLIGGDTTTL